MFDGKVPHWHHFSCFWLRAAAQSTSDISGFTDLRWEDQEKVKKAIESGGSVGGERFVFPEPTACSRSILTEPNHKINPEINTNGDTNTSGSA